MEINKVTTEMAMGRPTLTTFQTKSNVEQAKQIVQSTTISFDKDANTFVMKFIDKDSKEIIQQVPVQAMIEFAKSINRTQGSILDVKA